MKYLMSLIILLAFSLVVGCSPEEIKSPETGLTETPQSVDPTPREVTETVAVSPETPLVTREPVILLDDPDNLSGVAIQFAHPFGGEAVELLVEIARQFSLTNEWGIWVDVQAYGGETALVSALSVDLENSRSPDLIALHPYELIVLDGEYQSIDLTPYFDDQEWGFSEEDRSDIPDVFLEPYWEDEQLIALPFAPQATVNFYNQTWANELGFDSPPKDEQAFRKQSLEATLVNLADMNQDNDGTGGWIVNDEPTVMASWYLAFGGELPLDEKPAFDNQAGLDAFDYLKSVYDEGYFWISRQPEPYNYFANRYALTYAGTLAEIPVQTGWNSGVENFDDWTVVGFPGPDGEFVVVDGPSLMIFEASPEEQMAAWLFARYLLQPEIQAKLVQALFTLPVRESAWDLLSEFSAQYQQWAEVRNLLDRAKPLPISQSWRIAQWVLQDAAIQIFPGEAENIPGILEMLDATIEEFEEMSP